MPSFQSLCKVINTNYSEDDIKLTLFALAQKKQLPFVDMLYYLLEDETPLFFELFGGQLLKIPTKTEFTRMNKNVKLFLYIVEKRNVEDPFKLASYKYGVYLDKIASLFIEYYDCFIKNKPNDQIDLNLTTKDLLKLENIYNSAVELLKLIIKCPNENKRYTYNKRSKQQEYQQSNNTEDVNEFNYNEMLEEEPFNETLYEYETKFASQHTDENVENLKLNELSDEEDDDENSKQLSLFDKSLNNIQEK